MIIADAPSPNFDPRAEGKKIKYLILHYTGTPTTFEALRLLQGGDPAHKVSAHYLIDEEGGILRLVPEEMRAWHAGKSRWEGEDDINSRSIGIEVHNPGHAHGYAPFAEAQIRAASELCSDIIARHGILPHHVLAHSDIAPERKQDPGELFPWARLAEAGIGLWPEVKDADSREGDIEKVLTAFGYSPCAELKTLVTAFQRHFQPDVFLTPDRIGVADPDTVQIANALLRQKLAGRRKVS